MGRRLVSISIVMAVSIPLMSGSASARQLVERRDADDVESRLDIRTVSFREDQGRGVLTIKTYEGWQCRYLREEGLPDSRSASLRWRFDLNSDLPAEHTGDFECVDDKVTFRFEGRRDLRASRPDSSTARIRLPLRWLDGDRAEWRFLSDSRADGKYKSGVLFDDVDDSGPLFPFGG